MRLFCNRIRTVAAALLETIFPGKLTDHANEQAIRSLVFLKKQHGHISFLPYRNESVRQFLINIKHKNRQPCHTLAASLLITSIYNYLDADTLDNHCICAVPATPLRMSRYQYDHLACLLTELSKQDPSLSIDRSLLRWNRPIKRQNTLSQQDRLHNVSGALSITTHIAKQKTYFVIDDVTTTGATLREAQNTLLSNGADSVITIALAS